MSITPSEIPTLRPIRICLGRPLVSAWEIAVVAAVGVGVEDGVEVRMELGVCGSGREAASVEVAISVLLRVEDTPLDPAVKDVETISIVTIPVGIRGPMVVMLEILLRILKIALLLVQQKVGLTVSWQQYVFGPATAAHDSTVQPLSAAAENYRNQTTFVEG